MRHSYKNGQLTFRKGAERDSNLDFTRFCKVREARKWAEQELVYRSFESAQRKTERGKCIAHFTRFGYLASLQSLHTHQVTLIVTEQLAYGNRLEHSEMVLLFSRSHHTRRGEERMRCAPHSRLSLRFRLSLQRGRSQVAQPALSSQKPRIERFRDGSDETHVPHQNAISTFFIVKIESVSPLACSRWEVAHEGW